MRRRDRSGAHRLGVDFYFIEESGSMVRRPSLEIWLSAQFKSTVLYEPYLFLAVKVSPFRC